MAYNVEPTKLTVIAIAGDTIDMSFSVALNDVAYDMTGMQLDMKVVNNMTGGVTKQLSSAGTSPAITISTSTFNISTTAFATPGSYKSDLQLTDGASVMTIACILFEINPQIT